MGSQINLYVLLFILAGTVAGRPWMLAEELHWQCGQPTNFDAGDVDNIIFNGCSLNGTFNGLSGYMTAIVWGCPWDVTRAVLDHYNICYDIAQLLHWSHRLVDTDIFDYLVARCKWTPTLSDVTVGVDPPLLTWTTSGNWEQVKWAIQQIEGATDAILRGMVVHIPTYERMRLVAVGRTKWSNTTAPYLESVFGGEYFPNSSVRGPIIKSSVRPTELLVHV